MENLPKQRIVKCGSCGRGKLWNRACIKCGRPSTYCSEYSYLLIKHLASGRSFSSFSKVLGVKRSTLYSWHEKSLEFRMSRLYGVIKFCETRIASYLNRVDLSLREIDEALQLVYKVKNLKTQLR